LIEICDTDRSGQAAGRAWTLGVVLGLPWVSSWQCSTFTVVNVALCDVQREFDSQLSTLVWIVDAYTLTFASLLLLGGSLADWLGAKRAYISGLFVVASAFCGVSRAKSSATWRGPGRRSRTSSAS
jgi:MFS family permease